MRGDCHALVTVVHRLRQVCSLSHTFGIVWIFWIDKQVRHAFTIITKNGMQGFKCRVPH